MGAKVHILAKPHMECGFEEFLNAALHKRDGRWRQDVSATPAERIVEFAGRVCYMSFGRRQSPLSNGEYIRKLIWNGHDSVLEHATWTVILSEISRALTHQLVRHRIGFSYSQLSQQYHDESEAHFVAPPGFELLPTVRDLWQQTVDQSHSAYRHILKELEKSAEGSIKSEVLRSIRSAARSVLPNATETAIVVTFNARSLRHFLKVRGNIAGDIEMRCLSAALLEAIKPDGPQLFFDFSVEYLADGFPAVIQKADYA